MKTKNIFISILFSIIFFQFTACQQIEMADTIKLWSNFAPGSEKLNIDENLNERSKVKGFHNRSVRGITVPTLEVYRPEKPNGTSLLICPGGGYIKLAYDKEGVDIAKRFNECGITAFVLKYRLPGEGHEQRSIVPLQDAQRALRIIRFNADNWGLNKDKVGVIGFSAGGHLASTLGTLYDQSVYKKVDEADKLSARPDFMILVYPVISMNDSITHKGSRNNLLGDQPKSSLVDLYSTDKNINENTPPTFLVLANDDKGVIPQNSLLFYNALNRAGVKSEMHIYSQGGHGFGLKKTNGPVKNWPLLLEDWLKLMSIIP